MDEHIFEARADPGPRIGSGPERSDRPFEGRGIVSAHVQHAAECHGLLHTRPATKLLGEGMQIVADDRPCRQPGISNHVRHGPVREQCAVGEVARR